MSVIFYFAQVSIYAAIMWGIYLVVWRNKPLHAYSRIHLLISLVLPVVLPLVHIQAPVADEAISGYAVMLPTVSIGSLHPTGNALWLQLLLWLYIGACVALTALYISAYFRINKALRGGQAILFNGYPVITETSLGPGSLGRRIFFPGSEVNALIARHELAHIQARHRYDSLLLQAVHVIFWVSPAHWLLGGELKMVHEFEADHVASEGVDAANYGSLLLSQSFNAPFPFTIAQSFFHHPLKRRIMMLQKMKTPRRSVLLAAATALSLVFVSTVFLVQAKGPRKRAEASEIATAVALLDMDIVKRNTPPKAGEIKALDNGSIAFKTVDKMPAFNGSMQTWLKDYIKNPEYAIRASAARDRSIIEFTVAADGQIFSPRLIHSSGDQLLDNEALRAVGAMPPWKPGMQQGRAVPVIVTLPISFKPGGGDGC